MRNLIFVLLISIFSSSVFSKSLTCNVTSSIDGDRRFFYNQEIDFPVSQGAHELEMDRYIDIGGEYTAYIYITSHSYENHFHLSLYKLNKNKAEQLDPSKLPFKKRLLYTTTIFKEGSTIWSIVYDNKRRGIEFYCN